MEEENRWIDSDEAALSSEDPPALVWNLLLYNSLIAVENFALVSVWLLSKLKGGVNGPVTGNFTNITSTVLPEEVPIAGNITGNITSMITMVKEEDSPDITGNIIILVGMTFAYQVRMMLDYLDLDN